MANDSSGNEGKKWVSPESILNALNAVDWEAFNRRVGSEVYRKAELYREASIRGLQQALEEGIVYRG